MQTVLTTVQATLTACLGVVALASGLQGMLFCRCGWAERAVLLVVAFLSIDPNMVTDVIGIGLLPEFSFIRE